MSDALIRVVVQGDEAVAGIGRIDQAFARLERSGPTMALRSTRRAIDELANAATGLHPALGRVVSMMAEFGIGGAVGLGAVGGFAAIGLEIKSLISFSGELEKNLETLNTKFASLGGAGATGFAQLGQLRETEPSQPGIFGRLVARVGSFFEKPGEIGDQQTAIEEGIAAQTATTTNMTNRVIHQIHSEHAARIKAAGAAIQKVIEEGAGINAEITMFMLGSRARGTLPGQNALTGIRIPTLTELQGAETARRVDLGGTKQIVDAIGVSLLGVAQGRTADIARGPDAREDRNAEKLASALGREIGPLIAAFSGGGARGAVTGAGGIAATLASLNDPKTGKALLGASAPWLSLASGVLSGIGSLFGGGSKPKVIITAFEEEAARQIKELRGEPATTQYIILGGDARGTQQQLARLSRLGVIQRMPR